MNFSKKLFFIGMIATSITAINAVSLDGFDTALLTPYIQRAERLLELMNNTLQFEDHGSREIIWSGKAFAEKLYPVQKKALKTIKRELKLDAKKLKHDDDQQLYFAACQLHKAFKKLVYKPWKKSFKAQYETSKNNDLSQTADWDWLHGQRLPLNAELGKQL